MLPAFSSRFGAVALAVLLAFSLALPALMAASGLLKRRDVYPAIAWKHGPFLWIQQKIFDDPSDVDIAFVGSSHIWNAIDTPYVQKELSLRLGRKAEVFTLGWPWGGFDAVYIIAHDLLDHRRVHTIVITDEGSGEMPHYQSSRWFRFGENSEALQGLPLTSQAKLYGGAVLGAPRQLLSLVRPNLPDDPIQARNTFWDTYYHAPNVAANLGALRARLAYGATSDFAPFNPRGSVTPEDALAYSTQTKEHFRFGGPETSPYPLHFVRKLAELCRARGTRLVILQTPYFPDRAQPAIPVRERWNEILGSSVVVAGVAPATLFGGIPDADIAKLFYEDWHLNQNGQALFTPVITPLLLKLYADADHRD